MALYFPNSNAVLLLIPKTGSQWVREAVRRCGVYHINLGPEELRGHGYLALYGREFSAIGAFVRHPVSWHKSYWSYRNSNSSKWDKRWKIDRLCGSVDFEEYVERVTTLLPNFTQHLYENFVGPPSAPISFIGKQENLKNDLVTFLKSLDEHFDIEAIEETPFINSTPDRRIEERITGMIEDAERGALLRFGYGSMLDR